MRVAVGVGDLVEVGVGVSVAVSVGSGMGVGVLVRVGDGASVSVAICRVWVGVGATVVGDGNAVPSEQAESNTEAKNVAISRFLFTFSLPGRIPPATDAGRRYIYIIPPPKGACQKSTNPKMLLHTRKASQYSPLPLGIPALRFVCTVDTSSRHVILAALVESDDSTHAPPVAASRMARHVELTARPTTTQRHAPALVEPDDSTHAPPVATSRALR